MNSHAEHLFARNYETLTVSTPGILVTSENHERVTFTGEGESATIALDGIELYPAPAQEFCKVQVREFQQNPGMFTLELPAYPVKQSTLTYKYLLQALDSAQTERVAMPASDLYSNKPVIPILIVFGVYSGYHLKYLLDEYDVYQLIVIENSPSSLLPSLYTIDWSEIFNYFAPFHKRFCLVIENDPIKAGEVVMSELRRGYPTLAYEARIFSHWSNDFFAGVADFIARRKDLLFSGLGFFDDELVSISNTTKNIQRNVPILRSASVGTQGHSVAFIAAAGPSLDNYLSYIQEHRHNITLFSCGTALAPLIDAKISPDFHIELEGTQTNYDIMAATPSDILRTIPVIGPTRVFPDVFSLTSQPLTFCKVLDTGSRFLPQSLPRLSTVAPTVLNCACSVALSVGFRKLLLVGADLGTHSRNQHHAANSVYYKNTADVELQSPEFPLVTQDAHGKPFFSNRILEWARVNLEQLLESHPGTSVYNLSGGRSIRFTRNGSPPDDWLRDSPSRPEGIKQDALSCFTPTREFLPPIQSQLQTFKQNCLQTMTHLSKAYSSPCATLPEVFQRVAAVETLLGDGELADPMVSLVLGGTLRHLHRYNVAFVSTFTSVEGALDHCNHCFHLSEQFLDEARDAITDL